MHFRRSNVHRPVLRLGIYALNLTQVSEEIASSADFETMLYLHSALVIEHLNRKHLLERHQLSRKVYLQSKIACERMKKNHIREQKQLSRKMALEVRLAFQRIKLKRLLEWQQLFRNIDMLRKQVLLQQSKGINNLNGKYSAEHTP